MEAGCLWVVVALRSWRICSLAGVGNGAVHLPRDGIGVVVSSSHDRSQPPLTVVVGDGGGSDVGLE